jgi:hypothetical protein
LRATVVEGCFDGGRVSSGSRAGKKFRARCTSSWVDFTSIKNQPGTGGFGNKPFSGHYLQTCRVAIFLDKSVTLVYYYVFAGI